MKKYLSIFIFCLSGGLAYSQTELGIKFSPTISSNRVSTTSDGTSFVNNKVGTRIAFGLISDSFFSDNYAFSSGLLFASKRVSIEGFDNSGTFEETYNLQYLQVPLTIKLFTSELALDTKAYFQLGGILELTIDEKSKAKSNRYIKNFDAFDIALHIGAGAEKKIGLSTSVFAGLFYQRGLINVVSKTIDLDGLLVIKNSILGLDLGVKF